jgi:hypothetical protein
MSNYRLILETGEIVIVEMKLEDMRTHVNGFPRSVASKKYRAIFAGPENKKIIVILSRDQNNQWRDDLNPGNNGTEDQRNSLKRAIDNIEA